MARGGVPASALLARRPARLAPRRRAALARHLQAGLARLAQADGDGLLAALGAVLAALLVVHLFAHELAGGGAAGVALAALRLGSLRGRLARHDGPSAD